MFICPKLVKQIKPHMEIMGKIGWNEYYYPKYTIQNAKFEYIILIRILFDLDDRC